VAAKDGNIDALQLAHTDELLGADETFHRCIDKDGTNSGIDHELIGV
jgi:imidazole glycerol phosphate synthase subunit HisF